MVRTGSVITLLRASEFLSLDVFSLCQVNTENKPMNDQKAEENLNQQVFHSGSKGCLFIFY